MNGSNLYQEWNYQDYFLNADTCDAAPVPHHYPTVAAERDGPQLLQITDPSYIVWPGTNDVDLTTLVTMLYSWATYPAAMIVLPIGYNVEYLIYFLGGDVNTLT